MTRIEPRLFSSLLSRGELRHGDGGEAVCQHGGGPKPCFGCLKESIQAGITRIVYVEPYDYESELEDVYHELVRESSVQFERIDFTRKTTA